MIAPQVVAALRNANTLSGRDFLNERLVVGVSGGPDSLVLLDVLARLMPVDQLTVGHLDHGLRPTSAMEAKTVAAEAAARNVRFLSERVAVGDRARDGGCSVEEAGRFARYDFLARVARKEGAAAVVVGHNADDQVETILMHILRGSGLTGLRGMAGAGPLPGWPDLWLLRPLLAVGRAAIDEYCRANGLHPVEDASNADMTWLRNRLRHELLPLLESYNPRVREGLQGMAGLLAAEDDWLRQAEEGAWQAVMADRGESWLSLHRGAWQAQPLALRRRLLRRAVAACRTTSQEVGREAIELARSVAEEGTTGSRVALPDGMTMLVSYDRLQFAVEEPPLQLPQVPASAPIRLELPGMVELEDGWRISANPAADADLATITGNADPWTVYVALDEEAELLVRPRARGESLRPLGLGGTNTLKAIMIDRKIPAAARDRWPIVATREHALWVVGHVLDDRARVRPDSHRVVRLSCAASEPHPG